MTRDAASNDVCAYSIALGDDALILGQRLAEWVSNAPSLEEELALANVALDHVGRARMFYGYAAAVAADGRDEDAIAFGRDTRTFTNLLINELPRGDFQRLRGDVHAENGANRQDFIEIRRR